MQQGEYIAPEKIENIYIRSKYVAQVFVYGNSLKSTLICVIVPEESSIIEWANEKNQVANMQSLCKNEELKKEILKDITSHGKSGGLKGFEQVIKHSLINFLISLTFVNHQRSKICTYIQSYSLLKMDY